MKTDATLTRLLQEMPALTADLEGRLHGGFCAFCDTDSCEEITKDNAAAKYQDWVKQAGGKIAE